MTEELRADVLVLCKDHSGEVLARWSTLDGWNVERDFNDVSGEEWAGKEPSHRQRTGPARALYALGIEYGAGEAERHFRYRLRCTVEGCTYSPALREWSANCLDELTRSNWQRSKALEVITDLDSLLRGR